MNDAQPNSAAAAETSERVRVELSDSRRTTLK